MGAVNDAGAPLTLLITEHTRGVVNQSGVGDNFKMWLQSATHNQTSTFDFTSKPMINIDLYIYP